ncbi:MAG: hypothetical protein JXM71_10410 [Spirochaetales bacterium]|nr:hypothetical protein [Spirochaetales bacterium]
MNRFILVLGMTIALVAHAGAWDIDAASGRFGIAIINNQTDAKPVRPVTNTLGGSMNVSFSKGFFLSLQPGLDLYWTTYKFYEGRAVPTEQETGAGNNAFVLGFLVDLPLTATLRFNERLGAAASVGTAFLLRASFANDNTTLYADDMASNLAGIVSYFWSEGRWFYPSASLRFDVYLQEAFTFAFGARGFLPVFNAWTDNPNFWDEGILHVTMAMIVGLE